jgi:hypothetical protein
MANKELNGKLKKLTGKPTLLESRMELGSMLSKVFTMGLSTSPDWASEPWEVGIDKSGNCTLFAGEALEAPDGNVIQEGDAFQAMTMERAIEYVENPGRLFVRDIGRQGLMIARWDSCSWFMPWINPREIGRLWKEALQEQMREEDKKENAMKEPDPLWDMKQLRVGDEVYVPKKAPFSTSLRVVKGEVKTNMKGDEVLSVRTVSFSTIFEWDIKGFTPLEEDGRELPEPWNRLVKLGEPLFPDAPTEKPIDERFYNTIDTELICAEEMT